MTLFAHNLGLQFEEVVAEASGLPALRYREKTYSYADLNALANRLAGYMLHNGSCPGDVVAIEHTKKVESYALMLACLKIGVAYTNIDRNNPVKRTESILLQCSPKFLFVDTELTDDVRTIAKAASVICCDLSCLPLNDFSPDNPAENRTFAASRIAYIMFTSGSTGIPKGVAITHHNIESFILWTTKRYKVTSSDVFANISPMYFDNSVFDFYTALFSGASLAPIQKELLSKPKELLGEIDALECTIWFSVPSLLIYLLSIHALTPEAFQTLRLISFGGEGFPKSELRKLFDLYKERIEFINVYGPTEGTCICSSYTISEKTFDTLEGLPPLGPLNPDFESLVLDDEGKIAKQGELCLLGPNVGIGYYNDLERTLKSFSLCYEHGFYGTPMYRTGDLVYEENGLFFFIGRKDNQIKHMGYRIELEEIELALNALEGVSQASAIYERVSTSYGKIVAHVASENTLTQGKVRRALKEKLPEYMLPNVVLFYDTLPKNPNGKVDKKALSAKFNLISS